MKGVVILDTFICSVSDYSCDMCAKLLLTAGDLREHKQRYHNNNNEIGSKFTVNRVETVILKMGST